MNELMNANKDRTGFRWQLLATASTIALLGFACDPDWAQASDDNNTPPVWIELGGQFAAQQNDQQAFLPPFLLTTPRPPFETASPTGIEKSPPSGWDGLAKIAFEPTGTDWTFAASILYGKSNRDKFEALQSPQLSPYGQVYGNAFQTVTAHSSESRTILDFHAGRDVGLGMIGSRGTSVLSLGVRYAQLDSKSNAAIHSQPTNVNAYAPYKRFYGSFEMERKFTGVGPSLSWDASANLLGSPSAGNIAFDWGVNVAILFGRQRADGLHQTSTAYFHNFSRTQLVHHSVPLTRAKQVMVPNLGGFAGVSWRYPNAKVSVGYRADFFFGAIDGGIDTAHRENVGFYGPFASVSVGIGG